MRCLFALSSLLLLACTPAPAPAPPLLAPPGPSAAAPAASAPIPVPPAAPPPDPFAIPGGLWKLDVVEVERTWEALKLPASGKGKRPAICAGYARRKGKSPPVCADRQQGLAALAAAIEREGESRDEALADLEGCASLPTPMVRALRAHYAPTSCAGELAESYLAVKEDKPFHDALRLAMGRLQQYPAGSLPSAAMAGEIWWPSRNALQGQAVASRIHRIREESPMPSFSGPAAKDGILRFVNTRLLAWIKKRREALGAADELARRLPRGSYGRALAASELGLAYGEFVREFRATPIPAEIKKDDELRAAYLGALDQVSEPVRQQATRLLAEAGAMWAQQGVLHERAADDVHAWLSKAHRSKMGWQKDLLLPPSPAPGASVEERLAARLPLFASAMIFAVEASRTPAILRAMLSSGLSWGWFRGEPKARDAEERLLLTRGHVALGLRWRHRAHLDEGLQAQAAVPSERRSPEEQLWVAHALAYRRGISSLPEDIEAASAPAAVPVEALEALALAKPPGPFASGALVSIVTALDLFSPPTGDAVAFHKAQLARLEAALPLLSDDAQRKQVQQMITDRRDVIQFLEASR